MSKENVSQKNVFADMLAQLRGSLRLWGMAEAFVFICCAAPIAALGARWHWRLEQLSHFPLQYAAVLLPGTAALLYRRRFRAAAFTGLIGLICAVRVFGVYFTSVTALPEGKRATRAMLVNVNTANRNFKGVTGYILEQDPDILALLEVDDVWWRQLNEVQARYPHHMKRLRNDNFGIVLFSKHPLSDTSIQFFSPFNVPSIVGEVEIDGKSATLIVTHTLPPSSREGAQDRNVHLRNIALYIQKLQGTVLLLGDLNTSPWSPYFGEFLRNSNLRDSRRGFGIHATWPFELHPLMIPLDHILHSADIHVRNRRLGPNNDSDHKPVIVDITAD